MRIIHEFYIKLQNWLGIVPTTSKPGFDVEEELNRQLRAAKNEQEERAILEKIVTKIERDNPIEFDENEYIAEENLPHWLKKPSEDALSKSRPELKLDDQWVEGESISKFENYLTKFMAAVVVISAISLIVLGINRYDRLSLAMAILFFFTLVVLVIIGSIKFFGRLKAINQSFQKFADLHGLDYEISGDSRFMGGEYQGHPIIVGTRNVDSMLRTQVVLPHLRLAPNTRITILADNKLRFLRRKDNTKPRVLEKRFEITTLSGHLIDVISNSTILCQRLLEIEARQPDVKIMIAHKELFYEQAKPLDDVRNWQYLLNTLCLLARVIERADEQRATAHRNQNH